MLKNYIKIAWRNLRNQKLYSLINILGLALGLAFCILVLLFINDELTYDHFHANKDRIYRLYREPITESPIDRELYMPIPTGPAMKADFPEVEEYVRLTPFGTNVIRHRGELFEQEEVVFVDPQIFDVFSFSLIAGNAATALTDPYSVVITKEVARKYFGEINAGGEILSIRLNGQFYDFTVTGVTESAPSNSTIQYKVLLPHQTMVNTFDVYGRVENRWDATRLITYVQLREGAEVERVRAGLLQFMQTHMGDIFDEMREEGHLKTEGPPIIYQLQPLLDIHLNPDVPGGFMAPSSPTYSYIMGGIALAVLLIACINFMILTIARSAKRAKEIGMRKVAGAQRGLLMFQFWGEALLLSFIAFACGIGLAEILLPAFNELLGNELSLISTLSSTFTLPAVLISMFLLTGFVAGSYPALILSGFKPIESLKENINLGGANTFTKSLIVVQFGLSVFLVISTLVMSDQLNFLRNKNLGFQGEQVAVIPINGLDGERTLKLFRDAMQNKTGVISMSGVNTMFDQGTWRRGFDYKGDPKDVSVFRIDHEFIETLQMHLKAGRDFDPERTSDSTKSIIVNEAFLKDFGWTENPIGRILEVDWGELKNPRVIGVVEDFHYRSLRTQVEPAMMYTNSMDPILNLVVRIRPDKMTETIDQLRATWNRITNEVPFNYRFLDDGMDRLYRSEERWSKIVAYGSFFAIFVACLGLFGLAGIVAVRRQKEIGIRKVLGATVSGIVTLLSKDFARLVLVAVVIAIPVAYYVMQQWLQNFAYRTDIGGQIFFWAGAGALILALVTVSWQSIRAALANPVESLRSE